MIDPRMTPTNDAPVTVDPDWLNADVCIDNMQIAYDDATADEDDTPVDTVVSAGDLGVLIGLAQYAVRHRLAALASAPAGDGVEAWHLIDTLTDQLRYGGPLNLYDPAYDKSADNFGASWDGYWNDGDGTDDPNTGGHWVAAVWCNDHDEWHATRINPTHYCEPPSPPGAAALASAPAESEAAFRAGAEAMQRALADALRDHLNSRAAAIANSTPLPEYPA